MDLRQLRYFTAVVEEETVTAAARKLNMTQPPLTAQLRLLEKELNCSLFQRRGRRLEVTEAGRHFYQRAAVILGMCDAAVAEMKDFDRGVAGTLRAGVVSSVQESIFTGWITEFAGKYPEICYEISSANTYQLVEQVRSGQLEVAAVRTPFSAPDMEQKVLKEEPLMAVGLERCFGDCLGDSVTLEELSRLPLILYRRWEQILKARFEAKGLVPFIRCCTDTSQATLALAGGGMGIGILPASGILQENREQMKICRLQDLNLASRIVLICKNGRMLSRTARLFWEFMEQSGDL